MYIGHGTIMLQKLCNFNNYIPQWDGIALRTEALRSSQLSREDRRASAHRVGWYMTGRLVTALFDNDYMQPAVKSKI